MEDLSCPQAYRVADVLPSWTGSPARVPFSVSTLNKATKKKMQLTWDLLRSPGTPCDKVGLDFLLGRREPETYSEMG